jgi:hypothetical protein
MRIADVKMLSDGRNAHLIQQPPAWWLPKFMDRFELVVFQRMPQGFWIVVQHAPDLAAISDAGKAAGPLKRVLGSLLRS